MTVSAIIARLETLADPDALEGMARFGITGAKVYGIRIPVLRALAKEIGHDHVLALNLWRVESRETRILAAMIDEPALVDEAQMEKWVAISIRGKSAIRRSCAISRKRRWHGTRRSSGATVRPSSRNVPDSS